LFNEKIKIISRLENSKKKQLNHKIIQQLSVNNFNHVEESETLIIVQITPKYKIFHKTKFNKRLFSEIKFIRKKYSIQYKYYNTIYSINNEINNYYIMYNKIK